MGRYRCRWTSAARSRTSSRTTRKATKEERSEGVRAGEDRIAFHRGGSLMLDGIFVFDNAIHCYDMSDENLREDRRTPSTRATCCSRWARAAVGPTTTTARSSSSARWTVEELYEMVFVDAPTDMAMAQVVPCLRLVQGQLRAGPDAVRDGEALPGPSHVLRRRRPALPGRRSRARVARLAGE